MNAVHEFRTADEPAWLLRKQAPTGRAKPVAARHERGANAGHFGFLRRIGDALCRFVNHADANQRQIDKYLSESADLVELERRVRELDRNGWQFR